MSLSDWHPEGAECARVLRERVPEIIGVSDATDHATGHKPYMPRKSAN